MAQRLAGSFLRSWLRRWKESSGFRIRIWLVALLIVLGVAAISLQAALVVGAIGIALALGYGHAIVWVVRYTVRLINRLDQRVGG